MDMRVGPSRNFSTKELRISNCGAGEDSWRVPWTARRSNQSILREINSECSSEGLLLKLQYFGHLLWRTESLEKTLILGKTEEKEKGQQRTSWLDSITDLMDMDLSKLQEIMKKKGTWCAAEHEVTESDNLVTEQPPPPMFFVAKTWFYIYIYIYIYIYVCM